MVDPKKNRYFKIMMAGFGVIAMSLVLFFVLYHLGKIRLAVDGLIDILAPFVYGGVVAYLLRPLCNTYESFFTEILPKRVKKMSNGLAVVLYGGHS